MQITTSYSSLFFLINRAKLFVVINNFYSLDLEKQVKRKGNSIDGFLKMQCKLNIATIIHTIIFLSTAIATVNVNLLYCG